MTQRAQRKRTRSAPPAKQAAKKTATKKAPAKATRKKTAPKIAPPKEPVPAAKPRTRDPRLPAPGSEIVRTYKGKDIRVQVLEDGFTHDGDPYRSLTAIAKAVTGYRAISGPAFFRLTEPTQETAKSGRAPNSATATERVNDVE